MDIMILFAFLYAIAALGFYSFGFPGTALVVVIIGLCNIATLFIIHPDKEWLENIMVRMWRNNDEDPLHFWLDFFIVMIGVILVFVGIGLELDWYMAMIVLGISMVAGVYRKNDI
jgi:hypothetical protein